MRTGDGDWTRRDFVRTAAAGALMGAVSGAASGLGLAAAADEGGGQRAGKPRIGCVSWCFHSFSSFLQDQGLEPAIDTMGEIGFEGTDLILTDQKDIEGFWTEKKTEEIRRRLEQRKLAMAQFVIFQPVVEGLSSLDPDERKRNLDYFEAGVKIGKRLGAPVINIVAPWARELGQPGDYLPRHYELKDPKPGEKFHIDIRPGFDWDRVWQTYIETTKACLERVKAHGMRFSIEHHTHCIVHDPTAFLRLWDAIKDPALGLNLDTGWTQAQREYPPVSIHKAKRQLMNLHARDIDGLMRTFVPVGEGVMDFPAIGRALKEVGYTGFISIEQDKNAADMKAVCRRYLEMMREYLG